MTHALAPLLLAATTIAAPAFANDTQANVAYGGLIFEQNPDITMDAEDLYLSLDTVRVRYTYTNRSTKPVTILIAFPLPDVPLPNVDWDWAEAATPDWDDIGMKTLVNGKLAGLMRIDIPRVDGKDVEPRLKALGWPVRFWQDEGLMPRLQALSADDKSALVAEGLLTGADMGPNGVRPAWIVATSFVRTQTFPPGVPVSVEHSYSPSQGGTVGSGLDRAGRDDMLVSDGPYARFCVDDAFLRGYDRKRYLADGKVSDRTFPIEQWIGYRLSPGANWKGPIGRFRLTVDKGFADHLVSLCMDGLTKISPTRFEVVKTNYEPARDLDVLFVNFTPMEGGQ